MRYGLDLTVSPNTLNEWNFFYAITGCHVRARYVTLTDVMRQRTSCNEKKSRKSSSHHTIRVQSIAILVHAFKFRD